MSVVLLIENKYGSHDAVVFQDTDAAYVWQDANPEVHVTGIVPVMSKRDAIAGAQ